jgi:hypothetical protein
VLERKKSENRTPGHWIHPVSTTDQAANGVSLEAQEGRVRDWCTNNGYPLGGVFVERGLSGGRADNRPAQIVFLAWSTFSAPNWSGSR